MDDDRVFTSEAARILEEESKLLIDELRQEAIDQALSSRGQPVEVTASDVRRARLRFVKREVPFMPTTEMLFRVYAVVGVVTAMGGLLYPYLMPLLEKNDPTARMSLLISIAGLSLVVASVLGRYFLRIRYEIRSRQVLER